MEPETNESMASDQLSLIIQQIVNDLENNVALYENGFDSNVVDVLLLQPRPLTNSLYNELDKDINEQNRLHQKDDNEAANKIKLGLFFLKHSKQRPSELELAINSFSKAILIANDNNIIHDAYLHRAMAFLQKKSYYDSFYDSKYYLENVHNANLQQMQQASLCHIESCLNITETLMKKAFDVEVNQDRRNKYLKCACEFLDEARVELAIQLLYFDSTQFLDKLKDLDNFLGPSPLAKFQYSPYKHSNVYDVLNYHQRDVKIKDGHFLKGNDLFYERPISFLTTKALRYCGFCTAYIGQRFIPCSGCDEMIYCDLYCKRLAEEFGGHNAVCRYNFRVAQLLGIESYLVYTDTSKIRKIHYKVDFENNSQEQDEENDDGDKNEANINPNLMRVQALALTHIIKQKLFNGNLKINKDYYQNILDDLDNLYRLPFLKQSISVGQEKSSQADIIGYGLIDCILQYSINQGNIQRCFKPGKIVYTALEAIEKEQTSLKINLS